MNRLVKIGLLMALVVALFGTYRFVSAQDRQLGPPTSVKGPENVGHEQPPPVLATNHVLKATYNNHAEPSLGIPIPGGFVFVAIDGVTSISCPAPLGKTCTVAAEITNQAGFGTSGDFFVLCTQIDGSFPAGGSCPFGGPMSSSGWSIFTWTQTVNGVSKGTHTVQSFLETSSAGFTAYYNINYRVYVP